jgi:hypothetical protein
VFPGESGDGIINASFNSVTPEYFDVMGIHLLAGRTFGPTDTAKERGLKKAIVNAAFVHTFLNGRNPLGEKFGTGKRFVKPQYEIIGVVNDTKYRSMRENPPPIFYTNDFGPVAYPDSFILHVRSHGDPHGIIEPVRRSLMSIDPELPLYEIATLTEEVDRSLWQERLLVALASCFGTFALSLSAIGLYGILAYFVTRRQREIGVRMALGASAWDVVWLVATRMIPILGVGVLCGEALSWFASAFLLTLLYSVSRTDPASYAGAGLLLLTIGLAGIALPALRAMRVDPSSSLRLD